MKLRRFFIFVALVAIGFVLVVNFGHFKQLVELVQQAKWYILVLIVFAQAWSYYNNAKYYQTFLQLFGYQLPVRPLLESAVVLNFVNQIFPSGGVSGASYLTNAFKNQVPAGKITLAQLMRYVFTFISFLVVLAAGFVLLFVSDNLNQVTVRLTLLLILVIIGLGLAAAVIIADRRRVEKLAGGMVGWVNRLATGLFRRKKPLLLAEQVAHFFHEFYEGYHFLLAEKGQWRRPLLFALGGNLAEVLTVYIVFLAFGQVINPGIVIAGYTLANIISIVSVVSGGVGLYEATMVGSFTALGIPFTTAFSVVLVYRFLNLAVFLPVGFYYYRRQVAQP